MLSIYFGSDRTAAVDSAQAAAQKVTTSPVVIDQFSFVPGVFKEVTASQSLFGDVSAYVLDTPSDDVDFAAEVESSLSDMSESTNHFFIIEGKLLAPAKRKFAKHAGVVEEYTADTKERFNTFSIADAFVRKDKKSLWVLVQEARLLGSSDEEIIGILWWQLKSIRLTILTNSPSEAGMKDYPYRKAKQALNTFSEADIMRHSQSLLELYHLGHKGKVDLSLGLEQWVLSL